MFLFFFLGKIGFSFFFATNGPYALCRVFAALFQEGNANSYGYGLTASALFLFSLSSNGYSNVRTVGLDAAGKTTILYRLKLGEVVTTIPTIGISFACLERQCGSFLAQGT